ncbi:Protein TsetseEP [Lucilia cuprina]|nr:Protein TsetseEP [Lucilia cuprina]
MSKIILFSILFSAIAFQSNCYKHSRVVDNNFANILLRSSNLIQDSPQRSLECFAIYIPKINELTAKYELEYETCLQSSADARSVIDKEVEGDRKDLESSATDICGALEKCAQQNSSYEFFECHYGVAGESLNSTRYIQNVSKDKMEYIKFKFDTIEYDQNRCTDECSRVYVEESTKTYSDLDKCLAGVAVDSISQEKTQSKVTSTSTITDQS